MKSYKHLFSRALNAAPERLHLAAHSHHLWPDGSREAQMLAWDDAARLADAKWDHVMGVVWPRAQAEVARELNLPSPDSVVFASNTHGLVVRLVSAMKQTPVRILTTDGEFHTFRRQAARWAEDGAATLEVEPLAPVETFEERFIARARSGQHDLIFVSYVFFNTGRVFDRVWELAALSRPDGPWVVVDGYHGFMAVPTDLGAVADRVFYIAGGYKYAMAGEGAAFLHAPPGFGERPADTGWYAEFASLSAPPGGIGYARDAMRFMGATFDPSGIYRFCAVREMLAREGLTTSVIAARMRELLGLLQQVIASGEAGALGEAQLINPAGNGACARFLAYRDPRAAEWQAKLEAANIITDVRGDVLRLGLGLYHDPEDVAAFASQARYALR